MNYGRYTRDNRGMGPPSDVEFKKFILNQPASELEKFGLNSGNIDSFFTSPRDKQPYGLAWKVRMSPPTPDGAMMVIWEQTGVSGKRMVANALGKIEEIDQATFDKRMAEIPKK